MKKWIVLRVFLLLVVFAGAAKAETRTELRVVSMSAPPMVIKKDGVLTGVATDLVREGLTRAGYTPIFQIAPWGRAVYMTSIGQADALFYPIYTEERAKVFHYPSVPLFSIDLVILKRAGTKVTIRPGYPGLEDMVLGVGRGFKYGPMGQEFMDKAPFKKIESTTLNIHSFLKLLDGRIDMMLMDRMLALYFLSLEETAGQADFVRDEQGRVLVLDSKNGYLVFSKETTSAVDAENFAKALKSMKEDGTYQAILSTYWK